MSIRLNPDLESAAKTLAAESAKGVPHLPAQIPDFPDMFLAEMGDTRVHAVSAIVHNNKTFIIGTLAPETTGRSH